jgi:hypothetical protein
MPFIPIYDYVHKQLSVRTKGCPHGPCLAAGFSVQVIGEMVLLYAILTLYHRSFNSGHPNA